VIVADTSLISYLLIDGARTAQARLVWQRDAQWIAPLLWRSEFRNILALYHRRGLLSLEEAIGAAKKGESLLAGREFPVPSRTVLALAAGSGCTAYDCEFVALAQTYGVRLVTADGDLAKAFPWTTVSLEAFTA